MWNLKKVQMNFLQNRNKVTDVENKLMVAKEEGVGGGMEWEDGVSRCELLYMECINNKVLLFSIGNHSQYLMINHNGKEYKKECIYIYMCVYTYICVCVYIYIIYGMHKQQGPTV